MKGEVVSKNSETIYYRKITGVKSSSAECVMTIDALKNLLITVFKA